MANYTDQAFIEAVRLTRKLREQADFDQAKYHASDLHGFDKQEFSDRGRDDLNVRPNAPRFADNPMQDEQKLDEFADEASMLDRVHQMLTKAGITDQQIKDAPVPLAQSGMAKMARQLGIDDAQVKMYLNTLTAQLRKEQGDAEENDLMLLGGLSEQYYEAVNEADEGDALKYRAYSYINKKEVQGPEHDTREAAAKALFDKHPNLKRVSTSISHDGRVTGRDIRSHERARMQEAGQPNRPFDRYSFEPDALGSGTVRDAVTGKSKFVQGAAATTLTTKLKTGDKNALLAPLVEKTSLPDDASEDFSDEINARAGSYNFEWNLDGQHGTGTMMFRADGSPKLKLVAARDASGEEMHLDPTMHAELLRQGEAFLGQE